MKELKFLVIRMLSCNGWSYKVTLFESIYKFYIRYFLLLLTRVNLAFQEFNALLYFSNHVLNEK